MGDDMKFTCTKKVFNETYGDYTLDTKVVEGFAEASKWKSNAAFLKNLLELSICDEVGDLVYFMGESCEEEYYDSAGRRVSSFYWATKDLGDSEGIIYIYRAFKRRKDGGLKEEEKVYTLWGNLRNKVKRDLRHVDLEVADAFLMEGGEGIRIYYFEKGRKAEYLRADGTRARNVEEMGR